jgi:hypothetical protein
MYINHVHRQQRENVTPTNDKIQEVVGVLGLACRISDKLREVSVNEELIKTRVQCLRGSTKRVEISTKNQITRQPFNVVT